MKILHLSHEESRTLLREDKMQPSFYKYLTGAASQEPPMHDDAAISSKNVIHQLI